MLSKLMYVSASVSPYKTAAHHLLSHCSIIVYLLISIFSLSCLSLTKQNTIKPLHKFDLIAESRGCNKFLLKTINDIFVVSMHKIFVCTDNKRQYYLLYIVNTDTSLISVTNLTRSPLVWVCYCVSVLILCLIKIVSYQIVNRCHNKEHWFKHKLITR